MKPHITQRIHHQIFLLQELLSYQALDDNGFDEYEQKIVKQSIELFEELIELLK